MTTGPASKGATAGGATAAKDGRARVFFAIHATSPADDDAAVWERAATRWWKRLLQRGAASARDRFILRAVTFERDFKLAWAHVAATARTQGLAVGGGRIFTGTPAPLHGPSGLMFGGVSDPGEGRTLTGEDIERLEPLPWSKDGFLILSGSGTGQTGDRTWALARRFGMAQRVTALGLPVEGRFAEAESPGVETHLGTPALRSRADGHVSTAIRVGIRRIPDLVHRFGKCAAANETSMATGWPR